jgi:hypothetical protein
MLWATKPYSWETKHEDDFHDGGSYSDRHFCAFFHRDPRSGKDDAKSGTDHNHGTLLPVIRSRIRVWLYNLRAVRGHGFRHRRRLQTGYR